MFFPLRDENPTERAPVVNYALIALNVAAFLYTWPAISGGQWWIVPGYGLVPTRIVADPAGEAFTVLTSMFMHGGWGHLASNMLFLHIFGDNLEDMLGHAKYLGFYLLAGLVAALAQVGIEPESAVPMVGASGAIAGVVGGNSKVTAASFSALSLEALASAPASPRRALNQNPSPNKATRARQQTATARALAGFRRAHRHTRSTFPTDRAFTGSPLMNRPRSSASSRALA